MNISPIHAVSLPSWSESIRQFDSTAGCDVPAHSNVYAAVPDVATIYDAATDATEFGYIIGRRVEDFGRKRTKEHRSKNQGEC